MVLTNESRINQIVLQLCGKMQAWQSEAIRSILRGDPSLIDEDDLLRMAEQEAGLRTGELPPPTRMKAQELPTMDTALSRMRWSSLRNVKSVNALADGQSLEIGQNLTIIYGENGAGKTGYVRIIKNAFGNRAAEPTIYPNAYEKAASAPKSAEFVFQEEINGSEKLEEAVEKWEEITFPSSRFRRFEVFDARCANIYLNEHGKFEYRPRIMHVLAALAPLTDRISQRLEQAGASLEQKASETLGTFNDGSQLGLTVSQISTDTDVKSFLEKTLWTDTEIEELTRKKNELHRIETTSPEIRRKKLREEKGRIEQIRTATSTLYETTNSRNINNLWELPGKIDDLHLKDEAANQVLTGLGVLGLGEPLWKEMILAAETFSNKEAYPEQTFPVGPPSGVCVLCLRPLDDATTALLKQFLERASDVISVQIKAHQSIFEDTFSKLSQVPDSIPLNINLLLGTIGDAGKQIENDLPDFYARHSTRAKTAIVNNANNDWSKPIPDAPSLDDICQQAIAAVDAQLESIKDEDDSEEKSQISRAIRELTAAQKIYLNKAAISEAHDRLVRTSRYREVVRELNTRKISVALGEIGKIAITEKFESLFSAELQNVQTGRIRDKVSFVPRKGEFIMENNVESAFPVKPHEIFSEGERTALALSIFLSEVACSQNNSGIVLDDPVSSLDHKIRSKVVTRLVQEASKRQVIILTHNLQFALELIAASETQKIEATCQTISSLGARVGLIETEQPPEIKNVPLLITEAEKLLTDAKQFEAQGSLAEFREAQYRFYDKLRNAWERLVEEFLFYKVVTRSQENVMMLRLCGVVVDDTLASPILSGWNKASKMIEAHNHAPRQNSGVEPSPSMESELSKIKATKDSLVKSRKEAEIRRKPLLN